MAYHRMWRAEDASRTAELARRAVGGGRLIADRGVQPYELFGPVLALICADELDATSEVLADALADARPGLGDHVLRRVMHARPPGLPPGRAG